MKKTIKIVVLLAIFLGGFQNYNAQRKVVINREVETSTGDKMLLGQQDLAQFRKEPYNAWFEEEYNNYQPDSEGLTQLKKLKLSAYQIVAFVGTWCEDSHREFPRLIKILDALKYPASKLKVIAVNHKKESPNGEEGQNNLQKVPTFIVKKYSKDIGRIIEFPNSGFIERDLVDIIKKDDKEKPADKKNP